MTTKIEWTDEVWNPVTGCTKVSQGCKNCYAEKIANRFWGKQEVYFDTTTEIVYCDNGQPIPVGAKVYRPRKFTDVICREDRLDIPLKWREPRRVFVNSMSDLFHPDVPNQFLMEAFWKMRQTPQHTYQILTKRQERMYEFMSFWFGNYGIDKNIWLGVSVEDQATADERIPWLLKTPAVVRFVSYEPALGEIDINPYMYIQNTNTFGKGIETGDFSYHPGNKLDWIIAGCESGPGARPANPDWFRSVRYQCVTAGVSLFL
jgi:protein gp37